MNDQEKQRKAPSETRRRVRFQEDHVYIESNSTCPQHYTNDAWWGSEDYDSFKMQAQIISRESRQSGCSKILDSTFGNMRATSHQHTQRILEKWSTRLVSRRGLEMWCCKRHGSERKRAQQQAIKAVVQDQQVQRKHFGRVNDEQLARVSQLLSKNARIFATQMGLADQRAMKTLTTTRPSPQTLMQTMMMPLDKPPSAQEDQPSSPESPRGPQRKEISTNILENDVTVNGVAIAA